MKKIIVIASALILALILACVFTMQNSDNNKEVTEEIRTIESVSNENSEVDNIKAKDEHSYQDNISEKTKSSSVINKVQQKKHVNNCIESKEIIEKEAENTKKYVESRKFTPEEEELLKKIPRSSEVVVDKEIKVKSSRKYFFK